MLVDNVDIPELFSDGVGDIRGVKGFRDSFLVGFERGLFVCCWTGEMEIGAEPDKLGDGDVEGDGFGMP